MSMWSVLNKKKGKCYNQQLKGTEKGHRHCDPLNTAADLTTLTCASDAWWRSCQLAKLMMTHSQSRQDSLTLSTSFLLKPVTDFAHAFVFTNMSKQIISSEIYIGICIYIFISIYVFTDNTLTHINLSTFKKINKYIFHISYTYFIH